MLKRYCIFAFFLIFNLFILLLIKLIPNKTLLNNLRSRPWQIINFDISQDQALRIKTITKYNLFLLSKRKNYLFGSCLSISISGMIILDLFRIPNKLNIGIYKNNKNIKMPHAWLTDPTNNSSLTSGIKNVKLTYLMSI